MDFEVFSKAILIFSLSHQSFLFFIFSAL